MLLNVGDRQYRVRVDGRDYLVELTEFKVIEITSHYARTHDRDKADFICKALNEAEGL